MDKHYAILLICCPDKTGLVASVTRFLHQNNGNIVDLEQHVDNEESIFFMRIEWELEGFAIPREAIDAEFSKAIAAPLEMDYQLHFSDATARMAVFVSGHSHCLYDILSRYQSDDWRVEIPLIVSNHDDLRTAAEGLGIDYHLFRITPGSKQQQEQAQLALLKEHNIDFIVLARYMQILGPDFIRHYPNRIINIHHSFLPAFPGARPYHSAHKRGVKIIGATSHYVTTELDEGPIIEQDVVHVRHTDTVQDLMRKGKDLEKVVLSRAIWRHLRHQVLVFGNRTIVFG
ncbi:MAG: formyltetrahydrofolate deformylase [Gammaproteobacteria bacterium]